MTAALKTLTTADSATAQDVPSKIVATATDLYGRYGTHARSAREILRKAGVANEAAVRYYFGNKQGLLTACIASVAEQLEGYYQESWQELDELKGQRPIVVADVVRAFCIPFVLGYAENKQGIALVARLIREEGEAGQDLILEQFKNAIWRSEKELSQLLPNKSTKALRLHLFLAINNLVNGMVDQSLLWRLPAAEQGGEHFALAPQELLDGFVEYLAAGVAAESNL